MALKRRLSIFGDSDESSDEKEQVPAKVKKGPSKGQQPFEEPRSNADDDYMTLHISQAHESTSKVSTRPHGLTRKAVEEISRDEALGTSLFERQSSSMGLAMMKKMGFKVGDTLGKNGQKPEKKLSTPIQPVVKNNHEGVGSAPTVDTNEFLERQSSKSSQRKIGLAVHKTAKVCFEMSGDADQWHENHHLDAVNPLWRPYAQYLSEKQGSAVIHPANDLMDDEERLELLLLYLREKHWYCFYCGCKFDSVEEMNSVCPGIHETDHN